jgi:hypothetical protein
VRRCVDQIDEAGDRLIEALEPSSIRLPWSSKAVRLGEREHVSVTPTATDRHVR